MAAVRIDYRSRALRRRIVDVLGFAGRGHPASAFSIVEILRVLYDDIMTFNAQNPAWPNRDRFILSKGHGCLALYVLLAEKGFFPESELAKFCRGDGILGGHPEIRIPGVEASTGSLGHGLSIGIGMALNARLEGTDYRTFVVVGDGESNEGSIWEAAMCATKHKLSNLTVLIDYNKKQSFASTYEVQDLEPFAAKWSSFGFSVREVNGHNVHDLRQTLRNIPFQEDKPSAIICHTVKGKGIDFMEGNLEWHHKSKIGAEVIETMYAALEVGA